MLRPRRTLSGEDGTNHSKTPMPTQEPTEPSRIEIPYDEEPEPTPKQEVFTPVAQFKLGFLLATPLGKEDAFDKRFTTVGGLFLFSLPIAQPGNLPLDLQSGIALTVSRIGIVQPLVNITHIYFSVPIHLRLAIPIGTNTNLDLFAGGQIQPIEYDSRPTTDGGFRIVSDLGGHLAPDAGVGSSIQVSRNMDLRIIISYLYFGAGIELRI